jgi:aryl-alcohol dehydrogenase-like predicted oxidoreductase
VRPNQLVLARLLHQTGPTPVSLIGPRTLDQFDAAMGALNVKLSDEQLGRLDAAGS